MTITPGSNSCYMTGCGHPECRAAHAAYQADWKHRHRTGQLVSVDPQGARRRLQALMALGWPRRTLCRRLGYVGDSLGEILGGQDGRKRLTADLHRRICAIYDELCMTPGPSKTSRRLAAAKGWPPPLAWDDIDTDPEPAATDPERDLVDEVVIERILSRELVAATRAERLATITRWQQLGRSMKALEDFTGWNTARDLRYLASRAREPSGAV